MVGEMAADSRRLGQRAGVAVALGHPRVDHTRGAGGAGDESTLGGGEGGRPEIRDVHRDADQQRDADPARSHHRDRAATALDMVT